jgi:diguanylate cyclase (GGDEF)-like protein
MELRGYLRILLRKWWIVLSTLLITLTADVVFTLTQIPVYETTATFIVTPNTSFEGVRDFVSGLETLSRRTEIGTTYAEVVSSRTIQKQVAAELDLSLDQSRSLSVEGMLRAGTNVLQITVQGSDPVLVRDFADMVGIKSIAYVRDLYEAYDLIPLDPATLPGSPIRPNKVLNIALGAVFGLALGLGLAILSEYLQTPLEGAATLGIFDEESGAYNRRYFTQRLGEEMSRAKRNMYPLSLALMNVDQLDVVRTSIPPQARSEALHKVVAFVRQYLRQEDVVARLDETTFAVLLPDVPEEEAKATIEKLQTRMAWTPFEVEKTGVKLSLSGAAGVASYQFNGTEQGEFLKQASLALQQAEAAGYGKVALFSELSSNDEERDR